MFKSDSDNQGGEESAYGGMGSSFSDKAIRLNFIRKVSVDDGADGGDSGRASLCIWGISPTHIASLPQQYVSFPQQFCFISPTILLHFPNNLLHFPNNMSHFPNHMSHFPNTFSHFPNTILCQFAKQILCCV